MPLPPLHIVIGGVDYTYEAEQIEYTNVDPGGCEIANLNIQGIRANRILPGMKVLIHDGVETVWAGRVAEPDKAIKHGWHQQRRVGQANAQIACEGAGSAFKDNELSMIYIDRDIGHWQSWSAQRQYNLSVFGENTQQYSWSVLPDSKNANPCISILAQGQLAGVPTMEVWYDAGPLNKVGHVRSGAAVAQGYGAADPLALITVGASDADDASVNNQTIAYPNTIPSGSLDFAPTIPTRYAYYQHQHNNVGASGGTGTVYGYQIQNISILGDHGLPLRGSPAYTGDGFYTSDIALDVASRVMQAGAWMKIGLVETMSSYVVQHYVQYARVDHQQYLQDMAQLAPAHWGVWPGAGAFDDVPEFQFRSYSNTANRFCSLADCNEADVSERLANMYTSAVITWQDSAGTQGTTTVTLPNYVLDSVGLKRSITFDLGVSSAAAAAAFGDFALQTLFAQARTAGSVELPRHIRDRAGAKYPAYRLRSGIHRLRISDLPTRAGELTSYDTDSFRISRVDCHADRSSGEILTRVELDAGPNLLDTLQARFTIAQKLAGAG